MSLIKHLEILNKNTSKEEFKKLMERDAKRRDKIKKK